MNSREKGRPTCIDCGRRGAWHCEPCKAERRRLFDLHRGPKEQTALTLAQLADREVRVQRYRRRAMRGLPLFTNHGGA